MKNILTSKWFALGVGMVGFVVTMLFLPGSPEPVEPETPDETEASTNAEPDHVEDETSPIKEHQEPIVSIPPPALPISMSPLEVGEPGSLRFNNPDVRELVEELQREKAELRQWEAELNALRDSLVLEMQSIGILTQEVGKATAEAKALLKNGLTVTTNAEQKQLQILAGVYTNMPPFSAVMILNEMESEDIARILIKMQPPEQAAILEIFATNDTFNAAGMATDISEKMRRLVPNKELGKGSQ